MDVRDAAVPADVTAIQRPWLAYMTWGNDEMEARHGFRLPVREAVDHDLASIEQFQRPDGRILLACEDGHSFGIGCLRRIRLATAEIKRMFVDPAHRRAGAGRAILDGLVAAAESTGFARLRLDSPDFMTAAHALYPAGSPRVTMDAGDQGGTDLRIEPGRRGGVGDLPPRPCRGCRRRGGRDGLRRRPHARDQGAGARMMVMGIIWRRVPGYTVAQLFGAVVAALFLQAMHGGITSGATVPAMGVSDGVAVLTEAILTLRLVSVTLATATGARNIGIAGAVAVGACVGLVSVWGAPVTGHP